SGTIATPLQAVLKPGTRRGLGRLKSLVEELKVERIVVGLPLSLSGGDTAQTAETRAFARALAEAVAVPVQLHDERLTTKLAARLGGNASEDSRAAALLLQSWLDAQDALNDAGRVPEGGTEAADFVPADQEMPARG
ncbi:MAG: Holliday junction resolvase RuvX, partial [Solirubrobacteraceae bacterium]